MFLQYTFVEMTPTVATIPNRVCGFNAAISSQVYEKYV